MNWKIILIGSFFIFSFFTYFIGLQIVRNRNLRTVPVQNNLVNEITYKDGELPESKRILIEKEIASQSILIRGPVTAYNQAQNTLTVAAQSTINNDPLAVVGLVDINIKNLQSDEFLCWPEFFETSNGVQIDVKKAAMKVDENSFLYMKDETKNQANIINKYLTNNPFVFVVLKTSPTEVGQLLSDTTNLPTQFAREIAILGCQ